MSHQRLAASSLLVYFGGQPGGAEGFTVWLDPTWHLAGPAGVLAGSREAGGDDEDEHAESGFVSAGRALDVLTGRALAELRVDDCTRALELAFEGGVVLRTFVSDPRDEEIWHIRDNATGERLIASPQGLARQDD